MTAQNFYHALGIAADADATAIRRAHRALARAYHPDVNKAPDAAKRFSAIQSAYETLIDPERRAAYDKGLLRGEVWQPTAADLRPHDAWADLARQEFEEELDEVWQTLFVPRAKAREKSARE